MELLVSSPENWTDVVLSDFDHFLIDHANCERKAVATAMSLVSKYPHRSHLVNPLIGLAREELEHFHRVYKLLRSRGLELATFHKDDYVNGLLKASNLKDEQKLLDQLIVFALIEARGVERFEILAKALKDPKLKDFYQELSDTEKRHKGLFIKVAGHYFEKELIDQQIEMFLKVERDLILSLPVLPIVH